MRPNLFGLSSLSRELKCYRGSTAGTKLACSNFAGLINAYIALKLDVFLSVKKRRSGLEPVVRLFAVAQKLSMVTSGTLKKTATGAPVAS